MIHPYNNNHHLKQKTSPGTVPTNNHGAGMPSYLDSLARTTTEAEEDPASAGMPDEEYYGCTNPMANNWPGSKHETYGGYLHRLTPPPSKPKVPTQSSLSEASPPPPDEWYGKDRPMASWKGYRDSQWGGYLDSLSSSSSSNNHDSDNDNNNSQ